MEQYFVTSLSDDELKLCRRFKINLLEMTIDRKSGWVMSERHLHRLCDKTSKVITFLQNTSYEGIAGVTLGPKDLPADFSPQVQRGDWNGYGGDGFSHVAKETLAQTLRMPILLEVPHGKNRDAYHDSKFHVLIWSSRRSSRSVVTPETMWGIHVGCRDDSFGPSTGSIVISESGANLPVAEIVGRNLYIFHDACHHGDSEDLEIFRRICDEAAFMLTHTESQRGEYAKRREELDRERKEKERERSRSLYAEVCKKRILAANEKLKNEIGQLSEKVRTYTDGLVQATRELDLARKALDKLDRSTVITDDMIKEFSDEFDQYFLNDLILDVKVCEETVEVYTDLLFCEDPRTHILHELGKFKIVMYTSSKHLGYVRMFNLTRTVRGYYEHQQAGHVDGEGKPCFGNGAEIVSSLCSARDFIGLANYCIAYLQSVNVDDSAGRAINCFPEAQVQPPKKKTSKRKKAAVAA